MKFLPLIWRNLGRNKLRSLFTGAAIALAIALVCFLRTMPAGLDRLLTDLASNTRIAVHHEAGLVYDLPYAYLNKVRAIPGVVEATSWSWFGGAYEIDRGVTFPNFFVDPETVGVVFEDYAIPASQLADFNRYRDGALVGGGTLDRYGWELGDLVSLQSTVLPLTLTFRIVGELPPESPGLWFRRDYLEQAMLQRGTPYDALGQIWARIDDPDRVEPVMRQIDEMFRNSEAPTASETEKSFFSNFFGSLRGLVTVILIVTGLVALCIVFIAANTASMSVRERVAELAILKAMGFSRRLLFGTLLTEATLLAFVAGAVGALGSLGLTLAVRSLGQGFSPQLGPLGAFVVTNTILVQSLFLGLFIGILAGYVPAWSASRRPVAEALREVF